MSAHVLSNHAAAPGVSFRQRLQAELAQRCGRNARYSLRAFANFLGTDHASLSQWLRGKRPFTPASIRRLGARIGLSAAEIGHYTERQAQAPAPSPRVHELADDAARVLADWHAFAILELMRLREFRPDVRWIARMLGVEPDAINIALQHLLRLGFLQMVAPSRWLDLTGGAVHREEDYTLLALERLAQRTHSLQMASARNAPDALRLHGALTLAVDERELARLLALTECYIADVGARSRQATDVAAAEATGDRLYHVEVHCFPISTAGPPRPAGAAVATEE